MPKKSRALRELEAMEHRERTDLERAGAACSTISARLDLVLTLKRKLEEEAPRVKPRQKKSIHDKAVKLLDDATAAGIAASRPRDLATPHEQ